MVALSSTFVFHGRRPEQLRTPTAHSVARRRDGPVRPVHADLPLVVDPRRLLNMQLGRRDTPSAGALVVALSAPSHLQMRTLVLLSLTLAHGALAQPRTADPTKRGVPLASFPRFVRLSERAYAYEEIRQPGFTTVSLVVIGRNGVLLADGQGSAAATQRLLDEIKRLTPLPLRWYVVGSDHGDHTAGNVVLPASVEYLVHPTSLAQLKRDSSAAAVANVRAASDASSKGEPAPAPRVVVVPPKAMAGDSLRIDLGGVAVDVLFLGRAHTGGDLFVSVPSDGILFMSEAFLNHVFPAMRSAFPSEWVATVNRALGRNARQYVPGHGFVEEPARSREELVAYRDALVAVIAEAKRLQALGLTAEAAVTQATWGEYGTWFLAEQQAPIAIRRVFDEINGRLP